MANNKTGFNYWNVDTDRYQDMRIKRLKKAFSTAGIAVYDYVLNEIYRVKGCFLEWDNSTAFDVADYFDLKEVLVNEIVSYCGVVGLFEKGLLSGENIITSLSIQMRFVDMTIRANRNLIIIPEEYNILTEDYKVIAEEHNIKHQQSNRVKKSKVKKSKEEEIIENNSPPIPFYSNPILDGLKQKTIEECQREYFHSAAWTRSREQICLSEFQTQDQLKELSSQFNSHLIVSGTVKKDMQDWVKHFSNWIKNPNRKAAQQQNSINNESKEQEQLQKWEQLTRKHSGKN